MITRTAVPLTLLSITIFLFSIGNVSTAAYSSLRSFGNVVQAKIVGYEDFIDFSDDHQDRVLLLFNVSTLRNEHNLRNSFQVDLFIRLSQHWNNNKLCPCRFISTSELMHGNRQYQRPLIGHRHHYSNYVIKPLGHYPLKYDNTTDYMMYNYMSTNNYHRTIPRISPNSMSRHLDVIASSYTSRNYIDEGCNVMHQRRTFLRISHLLLTKRLSNFMKLCDKYWSSLPLIGFGLKCQKNVLPLHETYKKSTSAFSLVSFFIPRPVQNYRQVKYAVQLAHLKIL
ncbi:hypothetical protein SNEBB_000877 [Seison nebaliae]|nr:hypothetical protein SNEBB_000877 [Seison nebaliae]